MLHGCKIFRRRFAPKHKNLSPLWIVRNQHARTAVKRKERRERKKKNLQEIFYINPFHSITKGFLGLNNRVLCNIAMWIGCSFFCQVNLVYTCPLQRVSQPPLFLPKTDLQAFLSSNVRLSLVPSCHCVIKKLKHGAAWPHQTDMQ